MHEIITACTHIEKIVGGINLDWPGTPKLAVKQKYDTKDLDYVAVSFASPTIRHFDVPWDVAADPSPF
jgi:hypothetical protein